MNMGSIEGTKVLNQILNDSKIVFDTKVLLLIIKINRIRQVIVISKLEYFFIINYMIYWKKNKFKEIGNVHKNKKFF